MSDSLQQAQAALQQCPPWHPEYVNMVDKLASALEEEFDSTGNLAHLVEAITRRESLLNSPVLVNYPVVGMRAHCCDHLGQNFLTRYKESGQVAFLEDSIRYHKAALDLRPSGNPERLLTLNNLGIALKARYVATGDTSALDDAADFYREALKLDIDRESFRIKLLANMANILHYRFESRHDLESFKEAILLQREALELCPPGHAQRGVQLNNLANALATEYQGFVTHASLRECIEYRREAVELCPKDHRDRVGKLNNLAFSLRSLYDTRIEPLILAEAVSVAEEAWAAGSDDHPDRFNTRIILFDLYFEIATPTYQLDLALDLLKQAITFPHISPRIRLHRTYRRHIPRVESRLKMGLRRPDLVDADHVRARLLDLYVELIKLLPRVAYWGLDLETRFKELKGYEDLGIKGATQALALHRESLAVELLEEARAVFWSQALKLRFSLDKLPKETAEELTSLFVALERGSYAEEDGTANPRWRDEKAVQRRRQSDQAEDIIARIRQTPGFERFLLGQPSSTLAKASAFGPVVILLSLGDSCEALAFTDPSIPTPRRIDLSLLTPGSLQKMGEHVKDTNMRYVAHTRDASISSAERAARVSKGIDKAAALLKELWTRIVKPVINALDLKKASGRDRPRLFWCPTGPFAHVPLHAAGHADQWVSDYIVSSYTSTIAALLQAQQKRRKYSRTEIKALLVAEPAAPDLARLDNVITEVKSVNEVLSPVSPVVVGDLDAGQAGAGATTTEVVKHLPDSSILHLACHGQQHPHNPLESGFCLRDGKLTVAQLMRLDIPNALLAFLSACETAKGDDKQPDQAIHLAAAMLFVGFPSVIGTMWTMGDDDGPEVAKIVYHELIKDEEVDLDCIPYALDIAVQRLRQSGIPLHRWATFVHMGA